MAQAKKPQKGTSSPATSLGQVGLEDLATIIRTIDKARAHAQPEQQEQFHHLADIFNPKTMSSDPIAQVGAMSTKQGEIGNTSIPTNMLGTTYLDNFTPKDEERAGPVEREVIKDAGFAPSNLKGKIILDPQAFSGRAPETIPHELSHKGMMTLREEGGSAPGHFSQEEWIRVLSVIRNERPDAALRYLNQQRKREGLEPETKEQFIKRYSSIIDDVQKAAKDWLKKKGVKEKK